MLTLNKSRKEAWYQFFKNYPKLGNNQVVEIKNRRTMRFKAPTREKIKKLAKNFGIKQVSSV